MVKLKTLINENILNDAPIVNDLTVSDFNYDDVIFAQAMLKLVNKFKEENKLNLLLADEYGVLGYQYDPVLDNHEPYLKLDFSGTFDGFPVMDSQAVLNNLELISNITDYCPNKIIDLINDINVTIKV